MEPVTVFTTLFGGVVSKICLDVWDRYWNGKQTQFGIAASAQGFQQQIPSISGVLSVPDSGFGFFDDDEFPIMLSGGFIGEESFLDFIELMMEDEQDQVVLVVVDEEMEDVYLFGFDFDGFAVSLWPGTYSLYCLIVDPVLDEVLGFGYPLSETLDDPNPLTVIGMGEANFDFIMFDIDELVY